MSSVICVGHQGCVQLPLPNTKGLEARKPSRLVRLCAVVKNDYYWRPRALNHAFHMSIHSFRSTIEKTYQPLYSFTICVVSHNHNFAAVSPALFDSSFSASAALASAFSPTPDPPIFATTPLTTSSVAAGPPGSAARISPSFLTTNTPRVVPLGAFFSPIASMSEAERSHSRGYGSFCLSLKVVLALGESVLRP